MGGEATRRVLRCESEAGVGCPASGEVQQEIAAELEGGAAVVMSAVTGSSLCWGARSSSTRMGWKNAIGWLCWYDQYVASEREVTKRAEGRREKGKANG